MPFKNILKKTPLAGELLINSEKIRTTVHNKLLDDRIAGRRKRIKFCRKSIKYCQKIINYFESVIQEHKDNIAIAKKVKDFNNTNLS